MATEPTTTETDVQQGEGTASTAVTYFHDEGVVVREREEWGIPEVLLPDGWKFRSEPTGRLATVSEEEARKIAERSGCDFDAENTGSVDDSGVSDDEAGEVDGGEA
jgi:hypothetical protein